MFIKSVSTCYFIPTWSVNPSVGYGTYLSTCLVLRYVRYPRRLLEPHIRVGISRKQCFSTLIKLWLCSTDVQRFCWRGGLCFFVQKHATGQDHCFPPIPPRSLRSSGIPVSPQQHDTSNLRLLCYAGHLYLSYVFILLPQLNISKILGAHIKPIISLVSIHSSPKGGCLHAK